MTAGTDEQMRTEINNLREKVVELDATVRVVKHDVANLQQTAQGFGTRLDKLEERLTAKIDDLREYLAKLSLKQERGAGFVAGVMAVVTLSGGLLMGIAKLLFGGAH